MQRRQLLPSATGAPLASTRGLREAIGLTARIMTVTRHGALVPLNGSPRSALLWLVRHRSSGVICLFYLTSCLCLLARPPRTAHYDGADWKLKGEGVVCCPCTVPCPCRTNAAPSYGHCEATLYLRIKQGHYGAINLDGVQLIDSGGMCAISYSRLSALYFDASTSPSQQFALMKLIASFSPQLTASFPHVRVVHFVSQVTGDHLFQVSIPGILWMTVDRDWGQAAPPMPIVAAPDHFSNVIQYAQNIQYRIHDPEAELEFDYSRRQANYRPVDLSVEQYRSKSMLIQFANGKGWFTPQQIKLIKAQHLSLPQINVIRRDAFRLRQARSR